MKNLTYFLLLFAFFTTTVTMTSCKKDDPATCSDGIQNGDETGIDCGGSECSACPTCSDGIQNGDETGVDCGGSACAACPEGVQQKKYQSSGSNVAPLLVNLFGTDSIYARFNLDNTYVVEQYDTNNVKIQFEGTFLQTQSSTSGIWDITLEQTAPSVLTATGIFQISGNTMTYEVVQTNPDIGATPPTAAAGFGSTNGGGLGTLNVQTFVEIE